MATDQVFHATVDEAGLPILKALRGWLPGQSWAQVRQLLQARRIMIDGNLCLDEGRRLKGTEVVKVFAHAQAAPPKDADVRIRYIDPHVVVVEKPGGMTTLRHPEERKWPARRRQLQPTLDEVLPRIVARHEHRKTSGPALRLRPVHRLDRETSGLLVFARNIPAERALGLQFRAHALERRYLAVVVGRIDEQTFESHLVEDRGDGRRGSGSPKLGKRAVTHVRPAEFFNGYTLVECRLETGRTHQIRIHLSEAGHPVCGDKVYRGPFAKPPILDSSGAPRLALHAAQLGFVHPATNETLNFEMDLPADMAELIQRLRKASRSDGPDTARPPVRQQPGTGKESRRQNRRQPHARGKK